MHHITPACNRSSIRCLLGCKFACALHWMWHDECQHSSSAAVGWTDRLASRAPVAGLPKVGPARGPTKPCIHHTTVVAALFGACVLLGALHAAGQQTVSCCAPVAGSTEDWASSRPYQTPFCVSCDGCGSVLLGALVRGWHPGGWRRGDTLWSLGLITIMNLCICSARWCDLVHVGACYLYLSLCWHSLCHALCQAACDDDTMLVRG
jgi:hypothetical protein